MRALTFGLLLLATTAADAAAQSWAPARAEFARYGLLTVVCRGAGHTRMCLGLACRAGRLDLVSAAGGGGPMSGATAVRFGGQRVVVNFEDDSRALDVLGIAAARARVAPEVLSGMARAAEIELRPAPSAAPDGVHRFPGRGLAAELRRAAATCR
jgi:hypothetical protein